MADTLRGSRATEMDSRLWSMHAKTWAPARQRGSVLSYCSSHSSYGRKAGRPRVFCLLCDACLAGKGAHCIRSFRGHIYM